MKYLLLVLIRLYRLLPSSIKRKCLFRCSCSSYVYQATKGKGFTAGLSAFKKRWQQCRGGYAIYYTADGEKWVILADHSVVPASEMIVDQ